MKCCSDIGQTRITRSASMPTNRGECIPLLRPGQLHLWTARTDDLNDGTIASRVAGILTADERDEARRFHRARDRHQFVVARALARLALSHHFPVPAGDWRFARDHNRKPFIAAPEISPPVRFSVSHTQGLVACLITLCAQAAVDVEKVEPSGDLPLVARDRKSTRLNSSHRCISYAVFCLKKKKKQQKYTKL